MIRTIEKNAFGLTTLSFPSAPTLEIHTMRDPELDERTERFFEGVERLIFSEAPDEPRKAAVLRRYARMLDLDGELHLADMADQLAETYDATLRQFR